MLRTILPLFEKGIKKLLSGDYSSAANTDSKNDIYYFFISLIKEIAKSLKRLQWQERFE